MSSAGDWQIPPTIQPRPSDFAFDLEHVLSAVVGLRAIVPADAFTAETLGTERAGHGVFIRPDGLVLTIGYLITEAETVWLALASGQLVQGHALAYDQDTGFGLVQPLARIETPALALGQSRTVAVGERVVVAGYGGRPRSLVARIVQKQEFAGYWEYVLDEAIFTAPAHPNWGGTAVIGPEGTLIGIGSLQIQRGDDPSAHVNMVVPIDLLTPILDDLLQFGRVRRAARPWLGLYAAEHKGKVVIVGVARAGPADSAGLREGDLVLSVAGTEARDLSTLFRRVWALGPAGVEVPFLVLRDGKTIDLRVTSAERLQFLKSPRLH